MIKIVNIDNMSDVDLKATDIVFLPHGGGFFAQNKRLFAVWRIFFPIIIFDMRNVGLY